MAGRTRLRKQGAAVALAVVLLAGCGSSTDGSRPQQLTRPGEPPVPAAPQLPAAPAPVYVPLPSPIVIPLDSYADEPVVEYGTIQIPKIGLDHRLFHGVTLHNIDRGPSHWPGTAQPGERGNAVVAGHRVTQSQPFRRLDELAHGDEVIFLVGGVRSTYRVTNSMVVTPLDMWIADQTEARTATLYACHPPGSEAERYVVQMALESTVPV